MKKLYHLDNKEKFFEEGAQPEGWILGASDRRKKNIGMSTLGREAWNKGLTKETDESMLKISLKEKENIQLYGHNGCVGYTGDLNISKREDVRLNLKLARRKLSPEKLLLINLKTNETKKRNHSYGKSKPEDDYYRYLLTIYDENDIIRQYRSSVYPFNCDFYIKSEDKYIELNKMWTHGPHPYNENDKDDLKLLEVWLEKSKLSEFYSNAINVWTKSDPLKLKIAKDNNLNYEVIY